ncbi:hypothetical protein JRQ81_015479 [Phrynocephalus forsythii]|uniref:ALMS motif domain-containing protein n=1 Tax=Phrynocephalus forsythii TaxID=171643 RepID=A0A9Q0XUM4_9SAUR|nr:hypothetical protein JRQ81_015479 [Phrynocephalus forsythii]
MKSKSFELMKPHASEAQDLRRSQMVQSQKKMQSNIEVKDPCGTQDPDAFSSRELREDDAPQVQVEKENMEEKKALSMDYQAALTWKEIPQPQESGTLKHPVLQEKQDLLDEEKTDSRRPQDQGTPQRNLLGTPQKVAEHPRDPEDVFLEPGVPQTHQPYRKECHETGQTQGNGSPSQMVLCHKESRMSETPPLLWGILEAKAKSFELQKPKVFQTQNMRHMEPTFLVQRGLPKGSQIPQIHGLQGLQMVLPPHMEPRAPETQTDGGPEILGPADQREQEAHLGQTEEGSPHILKSSGSQEESGPQVPLKQCHLLQDSEVVPGLHPQKPGGLETHKAQTQRSPETSQSNIIPQQGLEEPQASHPHREKTSGSSQPLPPDETQSGFPRHPECNSPETPPLLWWALELAQQRMLHDKWLIPSQPQEETPGTQRQVGPEMVPEATKALMDGRFQDTGEAQVQSGVFQDKGTKSTGVLLYSKDMRGPKSPQPQQQGYKAGSVCLRLSISQPCESEALKIMESTQSLKTKAEVSEIQSLRSMPPPPIQKSTQRERDPQDLKRTLREQSTFLPEKPKDFKSSLLPGKRSGMWDSKERDHPRGQVSPQTRGKPDISRLPLPSLQTQEMLKGEREDDGPSCDAQALGLKEMSLAKVERTERVKLDGCTAAETQESPDKAKDLLPPGKLARKSKSLDSPSQGVCQPQTHKEKKRAAQVPDGFQMERQKPHVPEASTSVGTSGLEIIQAQSVTNLLQVQGQEVENQTSPRSILGVKSDSLEQMEPGVTQSQEPSGPVVLQPHGSPQSHPGNLALQGQTDPKPLCPQGHCEGGNCSSGVEDKPSEMGGPLQRCPLTFRVQITAEPQIALLGRSKSLELHEGSAVPLQGPKDLETPQDSGGVKICPQGLENQAVESCRDDPSHCEATTEMVDTLLPVPRNEVPFPTEHGKCDLEGSAPQKRENHLDLLENIPLEIQTLQGLESREVLQSPRAPQVKDALAQIPGIVQTNPESYVTQELTDSKSKGALECQEIPMKGAAGLESPIQHPLPCLEAKALESWWILGKSKSLDSGESHVLQSKPSGRNEDPLELQNIRKLDIRLLRDELRAPQGIKAPVLFHSTMLPHQEPPQEDSQNQDERGCEAQRPHQTESEPTEVQETLRNEGRDLCSQKREDVKFTKGEELEDRPLKVEESPTTEGCMEGEQDLQGLEEKQFLDSAEKRDLQSPALPKKLIRKTKTVGFEWPTRSDDCQIQRVPKPESPPQGQVAPTVGTQWLHETVEPGAPSPKQWCKMDDVLQPHEMLNVSEGTQESLEPLDPRKLAHKMEDETFETEKSLHNRQDFLQEQKGKPPAPLQDSGSQALPPHGISQFGSQLLQQLGELHNELGVLRPQELKDERVPHPQETGDVTDREESRATNVLLLTPQDQEWRGMESDQFSLGQNDSEALREELQKQLVLQSLQKAQGPLKASGVATRESNGSMRLSVLKESGIVQLLEHMPETSPLEAMGPPVFQSQESTLLKDFCLQESPPVGWEPLKDEGRVTEGEPGPPGSQEELEVAWSANSRSLEPQELSRTAQPVQHQDLKGAAESVHSWEKELNVQQVPTVHGPLQKQTPTLGSQETPSKRNHLGIHPPHNQRELKVHPVEKQLAGEQETSHLTELWPINLYQRQWEIQTEMGTPGPGLEAESPASEEWREAETWSNEGAMWRNLLTPGVSPLNLEYPEPGAITSRLQTSPPWEKEATETWKPTAVTMLSPPSPGSHVEDAQWERASFRMGLSREASICIAQGGRLSRLSQEEDVWTEGQGATEEEEEEEEEEQEARTWQPPPPRPPCREKAFVWSSRQEKVEAIQRLAELQAEGERRQRRDKERQILRFQERLSIARRRKSEDDLVGGSPSERWLFSAAHPGQDQAGQKTAVKHQLEKVKRERTYIMQSKRERNSLRFKELLSLHVAPREESPDPGQLDDL